MTSVSVDTGFGTTGGFGTSAFGTTTNTGGLFGSTQNKPGLSYSLLLGKLAAGVCSFSVSVLQSAAAEIYANDLKAFCC